MDGQIINALVSAGFATIAASAITAFTTLKSKKLDIAMQNKVHDHNEEKDDELNQKELLGGYRQMWQDVKAKRLEDLKEKDDTIARLTQELESARSELKKSQSGEIKPVAPATGFSVDIEPNIQTVGKST